MFKFDRPASAWSAWRWFCTANILLFMETATKWSHGCATVNEVLFDASIAPPLAEPMNADKYSVRKLLQSVACEPFWRNAGPAERHRARMSADQVCVITTLLLLLVLLSSSQTCMQYDKDIVFLSVCCYNATLSYLFHFVSCLLEIIQLNLESPYWRSHRPL